MKDYTTNYPFKASKPIRNAWLIDSKEMSIPNALTVHNQSRIDEASNYGTTDIYTRKNSRKLKQSYEMINYLLEPLLSYMNIAYWLFYFPSKITFDKEKNIFIKQDASLIRKITVGLFQLLDFAIFLNSLRNPVEADTPTIKFTFRLLYFLFTFAGLTFCSIGWLKQDKIKDLFNEVQDLLLQINEAIPPTSNCIRLSKRINQFTKWLTILAFFLQGFSYSVVLIVYQGDLNAILGSKTAFLEIPTIAADDFMYWLCRGYIGSKAGSGSSKGLEYTIVVGIIYIIIAQHNTFIWSLCCASVLLWSFLFKCILKRYFQLIESQADSNKIEPGKQLSVLDRINIFQNITILIDNFNDIFGLNTFFIVMTCTIFVAINIWSVATTSSSETSILISCIKAGAFILFTTALLFAAEVNNLGNSIGSTIKTRFQNTLHTRGLTVGDKPENISTEQLQITLHEQTQAICMINNDILSSSIGLKGHGFFTLTYSFLGTVINAVTTYSVVILQFNTPTAESSANPTA